MNFVLLHPKIVHLPIALAVLMPLISSGVLLAWWRGALPKKSWTIVAVMQVILVLSGVAALQTGEVDEEPVERVVAENLIEAHEKAAQKFVGVSAGVLVLAIAALLIKPSGPSQAVALAATAGTIAVLGFGYVVGDRGGALVYQHNAASAFVTATGTQAAGQTGRKDDDD